MFLCVSGAWTLGTASHDEGWYVLQHQSCLLMKAHKGCPMQFLPVIGFAQAVHLLEKSSPKQSAQYGLSSLNIRIETHETVDRMLCPKEFFHSSPGGEPLAGERLLAVRAGEALAVPRVVPVRHAALGYDLRRRGWRLSLSLMTFWFKSTLREARYI